LKFFSHEFGRDILFDIFKHFLWTSSITFVWRLKISNRFLEMNVSLIFHTNLVQKFLKKKILLGLNEVWNSTLNTIPSFDLTMSGWAPTNYNLPIPYGLFYLLPPLLYKELLFSSIWTQNKWHVKVCDIVAKCFNFFDAVEL